MPRTIAIDWDRCEARYVVADALGSALQIVTMGTVPLLAESAAGTASQTDVGAALAAELASCNLRRAVGLVTLERANLEMVRLTVPPCTDDELPEIVRHQALHESVSAADDAVIDFCLLSDKTNEPRPVVAIAADPSGVERAVAVCAAVGATASRVLVRPCATAALLIASLDDPAAPALALNLFPEEIDILLLDQRRIAYWRTVRLPGVADDEETVRRLAAEIHRTIAVALQTKLISGPPASAWLFGSLDEQQPFAQRLSDPIGLTVQIADPLQLAGAPFAAAPENLGRFAAPLAMIWEEARRREPPIDLLHPKQPRHRARQWQRPALLAGLCALALGYFVYGCWRDLANAAQANGRLAARKQQLDKTLNDGAPQQQLALALRQWQAVDIDWLDELDEISRRFPQGNDAQILRLTMAAGRNGRGEITFEGAVRSPQVVAALAESLGEPFYEFHSDSIQQREGQAELGCHFQAAASAPRRQKADYSSLQPGAP